LHFQRMSLPDNVEGRHSRFHSLSEVLTEAVRLDRARAHAEAARLLDEGLENHKGAPAPLLFQTLILRADLAVSLNELIEARGILAEAKQVVIPAVDRESLGSDLRRADDLEVFLTHRGCAG
jgi:Arc/MetJ-type ribon-helix-helix transcriptional regulator